MHISEELQNGIKLMMCIQDLDTPAFELKAYIDELAVKAAIWKYVVTPVGLGQEAKLIVDPFNSLTVELYDAGSVLIDILHIHGTPDLPATAEVIVAFLKNPKVFDRYKNAHRS